jgi:hypothetical protein
LGFLARKAQNSRFDGLRRRLCRPLPLPLLSLRLPPLTLPWRARAAGQRGRLQRLWRLAAQPRRRWRRWRRAGAALAPSPVSLNK